MSKAINSLVDVYADSFYDIDVDPFWNTGEQRELKMHKIHAYPAKFPAFISEKGLEYVYKNSNRPSTIADIFCGCGTVAFEARRQGIDFWGCDINPVATMIAKAKSNYYKIIKLDKFRSLILDRYYEIANKGNPYTDASERLKYWYFENQYNDLFWLKQSISEIVPPKSHYRLFFFCAFSNILKPTSRWLTKSIKPQVDPDKLPSDVIDSFVGQCNFMIKAYREIESTSTSKAQIVTGNFLDKKMRPPKVDMIITSPPYVTSYEYADLHQLSSLWLGYTDDYRSLRSGSIGSLYHNFEFGIKSKELGLTGRKVISALHDKDKSQSRSVAKYFIDMQRVILNSSNMLNSNGHLLLVVGDTEYKGIHIENARHLVELMISNNFKNVSISKRKITGKILTPYRNELGRFTNDTSSKKVYGEEFIILGQKQ